jgi:hypothetical protein
MQKTLKNKLQKNLSEVAEHISEKDSGVEAVFGTTYNDKIKTPMRFLLTEHEDFIEIDDEGLTFKYLDEIFELSVEDVHKNIRAITAFYNAEIIGEKPIDLHIIKKIGKDSNILTELLLFHNCIGFLNTMKIFYV